MSTSERPGHYLGRYLIGDRIGEGGAGQVYLAEMEGAAGFSKQLAIKCVRRRLARSDRVVADFMREAAIAKSLQHGNIVQIFDVGIDDGLPYLVMEYVEGVSLADLLAAGALPAADALYVIEQVAAALEYAHGLADERGRPVGVVHRDIKPRNILVSRDGVVKLTDFGIARPLLGPARTTPGMIKGSMWYMSPEQLYGERIDERTDQFSAGVVLHELLAGENPLAAAEGVVQYAALLDGGLPRLSGVDDALADIVARATAPAASDRWPSMGEFRAELERWRVVRGLRSGPDGVRGRVRGVLGMADARPAKLALDDQLVAFGPTLAAAGPARPRSRRLAVALVAVATLAVATLALAAARGCSETSESRTYELALVDAAVLDARPAPDRVAPALADAAVSAPRTVDAAAPRRPVRRARRARDADRAVPDRAAPDRTPPDRATPDRTPPPPGRVKINLIPYAVVTVDGAVQGRTPVDLRLSPGSHRVSLENPDTGQRKTLEVTIQSGVTTTITSWR